MFRKWMENNKFSIEQRLEALRPQFATAAQQVYDSWVQDEDDEYGGGGICQDIADVIGDVIHQNIPDINAGPVSASCGEQHVWVMLYTDTEGFSIDIPYHLYERGGGYSWTKIPGVTFDPNDIEIYSTGREDAYNALEYP